MIRRRLPVLAALLLAGATGCGRADDDAAETAPSSEAVVPTTAATTTTTTTTTTVMTTAPPVIVSPPTSLPIMNTTPGDLVPSTPPEAPVTDPSSSSVPSGSNTEIAVTDLAGRLDIDPSEIEIVAVDEVTWPDGSLGCPEPGMSYIQALVNGQRIILAVDGSEYEYHSGRGRDPFYCPSGQATPPASGGGGYGDT